LAPAPARARPRAAQPSLDLGDVVQHQRVRRPFVAPLDSVGDLAVRGAHGVLHAR
jgi:hypothetical protein